MLALVFAVVALGAPPQAGPDCPDPIEGTWIGLEKVRRRTWIEYTLEIRRVPQLPELLDGTIRSHWWQHRNPDPPACGEHDEAVFVQPSQGRFDGLGVHFRALDVQRIDRICGRAPSYHPDGVDGALTGRNRLDVVSDDHHTGPGDVRFRRVACRPETPNLDS